VQREPAEKVRENTGGKKKNEFFGPDLKDD
jgi:hypothetical protein